MASGEELRDIIVDLPDEVKNCPYIAEQVKKYGPIHGIYIFKNKISYFINWIVKYFLWIKGIFSPTNQDLFGQKSWYDKNKKWILYFCRDFNQSWVIGKLILFKSFFLSNFPILFSYDLEIILCIF